jgi:hypothetical protein
MSRRYDAFLVKHWALSDDSGQRVEVVHLQSGSRTLVTSLPKAVDWMQAQATVGPAAASPSSNADDPRAATDA